MRTRWEWQWGSEPFFAAWIIIAIIAFVLNVVFATLDRNHDRYGHDSGAAWNHSPVHWMTPALLAWILIPLTVRHAPRAARWLRANPPFRRVEHPLPDLRQQDPFELNEQTRTPVLNGSDEQHAPNITETRP